MNREIPFMRSALYSRAHTIVQVGLRDGTLAKPKACERCYEAKRLVAHYEDYSQPLMIEWLCSPCHRQRHLVTDGSVGDSKQCSVEGACETDTLSAVVETATSGCA